jgi:parallel beta-helix repeat protein
MKRLLSNSRSIQELKTGHSVICTLLPLALLAIATGCMAGTVVSGPVSGVWDLAGSPYWVEGDLVVPSDSALTIEPGIEVRFRGPYRLVVNGALYAAGTAQDSIIFTWDSPIAANEWRGLRFVRSNETSILEYCRIEHVRAALQFPDVRGGGVYCHLCSLTVRNSLIQNNVSHNGNWNGTGGGIVSVNAWPLVEYCTIRDNYADSGGGIAFMEDQSDTSGHPIARNNLISDNTAPYCGGGIYVGAFSTPVIENNIVSGNLAGGYGGGGIALWTTNSLHPRTVNNNVLSGNHTTTDGGGFYIRYDYSLLVNNTVAGNTADSAGGGVYVLNYGGGQYPQLWNTIIWGNAASRDSSVSLLNASTEVEVAYSDVEGGWTGTGNINQDPLFADGVFHLSVGSPCIDSGDPDAAFNDECFPPSLGTARNDMGAYGGPLGCEWTDPSAGIPWPEGDVETRPGTLLVGNRPNPFHAATEILFELPVKTSIGIAIYDVRGHRIRRLLESASFTAGYHSVAWDGLSDSGAQVPAGLYFCRIEAEEARGLHKMMILR